MKNAIILHFYYTDLWQEFATKLKQLPEDYDLYITLTTTVDDITNLILQDFPNAKVFRLPNKGLDVGPFLYVLNHIFQKGIEYNVIYKMHGKKSKLHGDSDIDSYGKRWRNTLVDCLIGSKNRYESINTLMEANQYIGMCGAQEYLQQQDDKTWMIDTMLELNVSGKESMFIAGTMFAVRFSLFKKVFGDVDLMSMYNSMPYGYMSDYELMHKLERLFGFVVTDNDYAILALKNINNE